MYFYGTPLSLRADLYPVEPKPGSSGTPGLRQSGVGFFFRDPALIPQRAVRALGNVPGYSLSSSVAGLGALNFRLLRGISRSALSSPRAFLGAEFLLDKDETWW